MQIPVSKQCLMLVLWVFFFLPATVLAECRIQELSDSMAGQVNTADLKLSVLDDPGRLLSLNDVLATPDDKFRPASGVISSLHKGGRVWVKMCLINTSSIYHWVLNVLPAYIESVDVYEAKTLAASPEVTRLPRVGNSYYRGTVFDLNFSDQQEKTLYLRLHFSNRTMADIVLTDRLSMPKVVALDYAGYGLYMGITLLVVFINGALYVWFKEPSYLNYALAALCLSGFTTLMGGYVFQQYQFWGNGSTMSLILLFLSMFFVFFNFFLVGVYQLKEKCRKLYFVLLFASAALVPIAIAALFLSGLTSYRILSVLYFLLIPVYLYLIVADIFFYRRHLVYSFSLLPLIIAFVLTSIRASGLGSFVPFADDLLGMSALIHLILINIVLVRRAWQAESDKVALIRSVLEKSKEYGLNLERKMGLKTKDLLVANRNLSKVAEERRVVEQKLIEAVLFEQKAVQDKREMVAVLSHEMRSPIAVIDLAVTNLKAVMPADNPALNDRLSNIKDSLKRLQLLVDNCIVNDKVTYQYPLKESYVRVDIYKLVDDVVRSIDLYSRVKVICHEGPFELYVEPGFIRIAMSNLIDNALKYSDKTVTVRIASTEDGRISISVQDQGKPIAQQERDNLFGKYYRSKTVLGRPGSGLGLYLVKSIAEAHDGTVELLPLSFPAQGNTFVLYLPYLMTHAIVGSKETE